jgi:hypothetical protein
MFIADVVSLEWDVLRWRRLKWSSLQWITHKVLAGFLAKHLDYNLYLEDFADSLAQILQDNLPEEQADSAQTLARECARNEAAAVDKVNKFLSSIKLDMDEVLDDVRDRKAEELAHAYTRREPRAVTLIDGLLTDAGVSMDALMVEVLDPNLDYIERLDHLTTIAESRRNASLREIDRRRAVLGEALRRSVEEIEDGEFKEIETMRQCQAREKMRLDERPQDPG